ncbi:MAG: hypothetical protein JSS66_00715 [Armatimonadetes bacterium]|nr:hypothetical protein [Armatimonadota bacterium]
MSEAKQFVGHFVNLVYCDRAGKKVEKVAEVFDIGFVPLYGPCMITDVGEFRLDRIEGCALSADAKAA